MAEFFRDKPADPKGDATPDPTLHADAMTFPPASPPEVVPVGPVVPFHPVNPTGDGAFVRRPAPSFAVSSPGSAELPSKPAPKIFPIPEVVVVPPVKSPELE